MIELCFPYVQSNVPAHSTEDRECKEQTPPIYIRNFSTPRSALYIGAEKKDLETLREMRILKEFTGTLIHDHETALYHFGTGHGECNVHLERYLRKNTEETGNSWSRNMSGFLHGMNHARKEAISVGQSGFSAESLERYEKHYDEILVAGREESQRTKGKVARKEEKALEASGNL